MTVRPFFKFLLAAFLLGSVSCNDKKETETPVVPNQTDDEYVNEWIYEKMSELYLWNDRIPAKEKVNFKSSPFDFFNNLLIKYESYHGFQFSRIEDSHRNLLKSYAANIQADYDLGFHYIPMWATKEQKQVVFVVVYVKIGTNVDKEKNLKRGDIIWKIDGKTFDGDNYKTAFQIKPTYSIEVQAVNSDQKRTVNISATPNFKENPIYLDTIYTVENNRKVGYVIYNSFEAGGEANLPYDVQLSQIFTRFKNQGVKDLILDLRYNGGGLVRSAQFIASALVPQRDTKNIFEVKSYNPQMQAKIDKMPVKQKDSYLNDYFVDNISSNGRVLYSIPRLGDQLDNLYVIGTGYTASASEMIINTLRAYRNVTLVGETTLGKNVGSWSEYKENDNRNQYVLWPIIFKSHNKNMQSEYSRGFTPQIEVKDYFKGILGDKDEPLLAAALNRMMGKPEKRTYDGTAKNLLIKDGSSFDRKGYNMYIDKNSIK